MSDTTTKGGWRRYLWVLVPILMMTVGQTCAKAGALRAAAGDGWVNGLLAAGYLLLILRGLFWMVVVSQVKLVLAYPLMSLTYVLVLGIAAGVFGEAVTFNNLAGAACIIFGVTLLGLGEARLSRGRDG